MTNDGAPDDMFPVGGISFSEPRLPTDVAFAVERELKRLWENDGSDRLALAAAGFTAAPGLANRKSGRPPISQAEHAVRARQALSDPGAHAEKALNRARDAGILQRRPNAHEFTSLGRDLLKEVDAAKRAIEQAGDAPTSLPYALEIVEAAFGDLGRDGKACARTCPRRHLSVAGLHEPSVSA